MNARTLLGSGPSSSARGGIRALLLLGLAVVVLVPVIYMTFVLNWSYSEGERAGVLQKFSRKGWIFKTWEGELAMTTVPGVAPVLWNFSVRDDKVAEALSRAIGTHVAVHYEEHRGIPTSAFGETNYFVNSVRKIE